MNINEKLGKYRTEKGRQLLKGLWVMKKIYAGLLLLGGCAVAFSGGVLAGVVKNRIQTEPTEHEQEVVRAVIGEEETVPVILPETAFFVVVTRDNHIILKEVFDDKTEVEIERAEINKSVLPKEDISLLEEGISFFDKDEALMMMENFVS